MSKSKNKNYKIEDSKYQDGYHVDKRKTATIDKRKDRRFERALRTKNADALIEEDEDEGMSLFDEWNDLYEDDYR